MGWLNKTDVDNLFKGIQDEGLNQIFFVDPANHVVLSCSFLYFPWSKTTSEMV